MPSWGLLDQRDCRRGQEVRNEFAASIVLVRFRLDSRFLSIIIIIFYYYKPQQSILNFSCLTDLGAEFVLYCSLELEREGWGTRVFVQSWESFFFELSHHSDDTSLQRG